MHSRKSRLIFTFLLLTVAVFSAGATGFVNVRNFDKSQYGGGTQNWDVVQDSLGRMYFANTDGMLMYDGVRWKKYFLPNYTTVRSLMFDGTENRIYAGGSEEFGYFTPDSKTGNLRYVSLVDFLPKNRPSFTEIWNIFRNEGKLWFQADNQLMCLDKDYIHIYAVDGRISTSGVVGNKVYVGLEDGRILTEQDGRFSDLPGLNNISGKKIVSILPFGKGDKILIGTSVDGVFVYDGERVLPLSNNAINEFLKTNQLFCATLKGDVYVFGSVNLGVVTLNIVSGKTNYINKESGLQNNTVLDFGFDRESNLWLCLDNGIDYAVLNSATTNLLGRNRSIGAGYSSLVMGDRVYYGTNQGLYSTVYPRDDSPVPPQLSRHIQGQIWAMTDSPHGVLIASDAGVYVMNNNAFGKIDNVSGTYKIEMLKGHDDEALASTYDGFHLLRWSVGGWHDAGTISGYNDINGAFIIDAEGTVWLSHWRKGVYRLRIDEKAMKFYDVRLYDTADGFPSNQNNDVAMFDGRIVFSTQQGFYRFNEQDKTHIVPDVELNEAVESSSSGDIRTLPDGSLAYVTGNGVSIVTKRNDDSLKVRHLSLGAINKELIHGFVHLNSVSAEELIVSTQEGFTNINLSKTIESGVSPSVIFGAIVANRDSLIYTPGLVSGEIKNIELSHKLNTLRFEFACPVYDYAGRIEYSSYLENYDDDWTPYSSETSREYTRLGDGNYVMHLRARDTKTGEVQSAGINFSIKAPWYRARWTKVVYYTLSVLFLLSLVGLVRNRQHKIRRNIEKRKEREMQALRKQSEAESEIKDSQIASLMNEQQEQDLRHRSRELSNTTMSLIHLNEVLTDISSQISHIQELANGENPKSVVIKPLAKIKTSIENILSDERDTGAFYTNFDIVYSDYTKRLMDRFPGLTLSEKRLCCYIRMGLSSKEIAPLVNISYKSVEMARYRLRKKLNLPGEISLTDFLMSV